MKKIQNKPSIEIMGYKISQDRYQFILDGVVKVGVDENGKEESWKHHTFHQTLSSALRSIREHNIRAVTIDSKTLEEALRRMKAWDDEFEVLLAPLKKLEESNPLK